MNKNLHNLTVSDHLMTFDFRKKLQKLIDMKLADKKNKRNKILSYNEINYNEIIMK